MTTAFDHAVLAVRAGRDDHEAATELLEQLTAHEKLALLDGDKEFWRGMLDFYVDGYNTEPLVAGQIDRLGIPGIRFADGPRGCVVGHGTTFPVAMARGASWDPELELRIGRAIGAEARSQGANFFAGVCINLLRHPAWGRAQETYGEDSVLLGAMGEALARGAQENVMACVKHFALNSMENARFTVDVNVADDALREIYLPHFRQVVESGVAAVMSSYNAVNGVIAGDNHELLTGILRQEWGFEGLVVSDFVYGLRDPVGSVAAGLDIEMPFRQQRASTLEDALADGRLALADVHRAGTRILRMQLRFAAAVTSPVPDVSVMASPEHRALARYAAGRSAVLVHNATVDGRPFLPRSVAELGDVAVLGALSTMDNTGDRGSSSVRSPHVVSVAEGMVAALGAGAVTIDDGSDLDRARRTARAAQTVVVVVGYTAADEGEYIDDDNPDLVSTVFPDGGDPALVRELALAQEGNAGEFGSGSGGDRRSLRLAPEQEELVRTACAANPRTVVVIVAGSAVVVEPWHDLPAAIVYGWYSGMEGGHALADILLGVVEPAGRLPFVVPQSESQLPGFDPDAVAVEYDHWYGYRLMDRDGTTPRYPFGYGLGYGQYSIVAATVESVTPDLRVEVTVENAGGRDGSHVVQVYGGPRETDPTRPRRQLLGFGRVDVPAHGRATVSVPVSLSPTMRWDIDARAWMSVESEITLEVGSHHGDPHAVRLTVGAPGAASTAADHDAADTGTVPGLRPWHDASLPVDERVEALLAAMTVEEKVAQLGSHWVFDHQWGEENSAETSEHHVAPVTAMTEADGGHSLEAASRNGLGQLTRVYGSYPITPAEGAAELVRRQHVVVDGSRLGIPAVVHEECLTGFTAYGATVYPTSLAWGATFDPDLVREMAAAIGADMTALGVNQALAPVLDVVRDYRWGRVEECISEDPYLVSMVGTAYVRGLQSSGLVATLKHFAGYSASRGARNHGPVSMGRRELVDVILPSFEAAIVLGGARSVMNSYTDVDGVPCVASSWLLTDVLREQWGFTGTVVADYGAIPMLETAHQTAATPAEAGAQALAAGLDVELPDTACFGDLLVDRVTRGLTPEHLVDRAVRRVVRQKIELGLLDEGWTPEAAVATAGQVDLDSAANRDVARRVAEESVVLLDAGTALPLLGDGRTPPRRVAVVGPCADEASTLLGCYAFPNHVLPRYPELALGIDVPTPLAALRAELDGAEVVHAQGCQVMGEDRSAIADAVAAAQDADVCIALVGDRAGMFGKGSSGEGCDASDLRLPGVQAELVEALLRTGTPVVVVVVSGRPYALGDVHGRAAGLVQAFMPGAEGAAAVAGVMTGRINPSGHLPVQIPRTPAQVASYLQPPLGGGGEGSWVSTIDASPLFPFGYGSSYTRFVLDDHRVSATQMATDGEVSVTVRVTNTGGRSGAEVVQLYLRDPVAQVVRPLLQLVGFARVVLEPGAAADVTFRLHADRTSYPTVDLQRIVEAGDIELSVGTSSGDLPWRTTVRLTGPTRVVGPDRQLETPVVITPVDDATRQRRPR